MSKVYIYSLDHRNLMKLGFSEMAHVMDKLENPDDKTQEVISNLIEKDVYKPMMSISKEQGNNYLSEEQLEHLSSLSGKTASYSERPDFDYCKDLMEKPAWHIKDTDLLISDEHMTLLNKSKVASLMDTTPDIEKSISEDFPDNEPQYFLSFRGNNFKNNIKKAKDILAKEGAENFHEILDESDKPTRLAFESVLINKALSLKSGANVELGDAGQMLYVFHMMDDKYINEYKNAVGLASTSGHEDVKKIYRSIEDAQKLTSQYLQHMDSNKDYADNVIVKEIDKLLENTKNYSEDTLYARMISQENEESKKLDKPKHKLSGLSI